MKHDFDDFLWHSAVGGDGMTRKSEVSARIPNSKKAKRMFVASSSDRSFLIHKTSKSLWRVSDDKKYIESVFPTDVLTAEQLKELEESE